jgi:hypothetical protein
MLDAVTRSYDDFLEKNDRAAGDALVAAPAS